MFSRLILGIFLIGSSITIFAQNEEQFLNESLDLFREKYQVNRMLIYEEVWPFLLEEKGFEYCSEKLKDEISPDILNSLFQKIDDKSYKGEKWSKGYLDNVKLLTMEDRNKLQSKNSKEDMKALKSFRKDFGLEDVEDWLSAMDSVTTKTGVSLEDYYKSPLSDRNFWYLSYPVVDYENGYALLGFGGGQSLTRVVFHIYLLKKKGGKWTISKSCYGFVS